MAAHVITTIGGLPTAPLAYKCVGPSRTSLTCYRVRRKLYTRLWQDLIRVEGRITGELSVASRLPQADIAQQGRPERG